MPKAPYTKDQVVSRQLLADLRRLFVEDIMLQGDATIRSSGGRDIHIAPGGTGHLYVDDNPVGGKFDSLDWAEVSPDYEPDDVFNHYPTIQQALDRADYLVATYGRTQVHVRVRPGIYAEEGLYVRDNVFLSMDEGAVLVGPSNPTATYPELAPTHAMLLASQGTGRIDRARINPRNTVDVTGYPLVVDTGSVQPIIQNINLDMTLGMGGSWSAGLYVANNLTSLATFEDLYKSLVIVKDSFFAYAQLDAGGNPVTAYGTPMVLVDGPNVLLCYNLLMFGLFTKACVEFKDSVSGGATAFMTGGYLFNLWWSGFTPQQGPQLINTAHPGNPQVAVVEALDMSAIPSLCDFQEGYLTLTPAASIEQDTYVESGFSGASGTVEYAIGRIYDHLLFHDTQIENAQTNIAIIATTLDYDAALGRGDYEGMLVDAFTDAAQIDLAYSHGYEIADGKLYFRSVVWDEDFNGYADTAALQAAWPLVAGSLTTSLQSVGADKYVEIDYQNAGSSGAAIRYTLPAKLDQGVQPPGIRFCMYGDSGPATVGFYIRLLTTAGNSYRYGPYYPMQDADGQWVNVYTTSCTPIGVTNDLAPFNITQVQIEMGTVANGQQGTFQVDDIEVLVMDNWTQDTLVESWDIQTDVDNWTIAVSGGSLPTKTLHTTTPAPRDGAGSIKIAGWSTGISPNITLSRSYGAPVDLGSDSYVARLWAAVPTYGVGDEYLTPVLKLYDSAGRTLTVPAAPETFYIGELYGNWGAINFLLGDGTYSDPNDIFDLTAVDQIDIVFSSVGVVPTVDGLLLDRLEIGKPPTVVSTSDTTWPVGSNELSVNATYNRPWETWINSWIGGVQPPDNMMLLRAAADGSGDATVFNKFTGAARPEIVDGIGGYKQDLERADYVFGDWFPVTRTGGLRYRICAVGLSDPVYGNQGVFTVSVGGVAAAWRTI